MYKTLLSSPSSWTYHFGVSIFTFTLKSCNSKVQTWTRILSSRINGSNSDLENSYLTDSYDFLLIFRNNKYSNAIPIYNYVAKDNLVTWDQFKELSAKYNLPTIRAVWHSNFSNTSNKFVHQFYMYFLHLLPALIVDGIFYCIGKQPK